MSRFKQEARVLHGWPARAALLLGLVFLLGLAAVNAVPDGGHGIGLWPVGGATAALVLAPRRWAPLLAAAAGVVAMVTFALGGLPTAFSIAVAVGTAVGVWAAWRGLVHGGEEPPGLLTSADLKRFFSSAALGAVVVAAATAVGAALSGRGDPALTAVTVGMAQVASQLTVLPFFLRLPAHGSVAPPVERVLQWFLLATVTLVIFLPHDFPSLVFAILPLLAWGGLRANPWEALAQSFVVFAIAIQLTSFGFGPFADVVQEYGLPVDARPILLALFGLDCAAVVVPMVQIVGEQLTLAREAAAERDKVQNIVNSATGVAIIGTDAQGRITLFNPGAQRLLGYSPDEVLGRSPAMFYSREVVAEKARELGVHAEIRELAAAMAVPTLAGQEIPFLRKDGVERTHSVTLTRMVGGRGEHAGFVSTSEDVTDRVELRRTLMEALDAERTAGERLREVDRVKDTFVGSVSHELRTPITSIVGYLEMLEEGEFGDLSAAQADAVRRVSANSSRLLLLIDDLLTLSRVEDDGLVLADRALDLRALVRAGHDVVSPSWEARDLKVHLELPDDPVPFLGDRDMIERVVVNLVSNAVKFTPDGGRVRVDLTADGDTALIEVADTGLGIPAEEQGRIFSRFFRSSLAQKQAIPGSGLGLSIARAVVEKHGGRVELDSAEGEGTTFRVWLPVVV